MKHAIRKVVVLGAGTMGAQVAAHLVAQGLDVALLDMVPPGAADRSLLAKKALQTLARLKPSPLHLPDHAALLRPGNFEDDWKELQDADWVFEAVVDPGRLSSFFTTGGAQGRLETGATVTWDFHDFPGAFPVEVTEVVKDQRITLRWDSSDAGGGADGNFVSLDREAGKLAANRLRYDMVSVLVKTQLDGLMKAANDGKGG